LQNRQFAPLFHIGFSTTCIQWFDPRGTAESTTARSAHLYARYIENGNVNRRFSLVSFIREEPMRRFVISSVIAALALIVAVSAEPPVSPPADQGPSIRQFMTPDGRIDINSVRSSGYQGPLDLTGVDVRVDSRSSPPMVAAFSPQSPTDDPDDIYWDNSISPSIPGVNGPVFAMTIYDGELIVGGYFSAAGGVMANNIAAWDGTSWSPLGLGIFGSEPEYPYLHIGVVNALTVYDGKLIAGGHFGAAGSDSVNNIAAWDGTSWSPLGSGMGGVYYPCVNTLTVFDGKLVAGGWFAMAGGVEANKIASWDGTAWSALGYGITGGGGYWGPVVYALTSYEGRLIAGGNFAVAGSDSANGIAAWDGTDWSPLGSGLDGSDPDGVRALTVYDSKLIAGGGFSTGLISVWDGDNWSPIMTPGGAVSTREYVTILTVHDNKLLAGVNFVEMVASSAIVVWNGVGWSGLASQMSGIVSAQTVYDNKLVIGGSFSSAGGSILNNMAYWDGSNWSSPGSHTNGFVRALTVYDGRLIAGGSFTAVGGVVANHRASWDGSSWSKLGSGLNRRVYALTVYEEKLIAAGDFTTAGSDSAYHIAAWDGTSWSPLGSGLGGDLDPFTSVFALTVFDGKLIVGGYFTMAGGDSANLVAAWDGASWSAIGSGMPEGRIVSLGTVLSLIIHDGKLIAGGFFGLPSSDTASLVAAWDGISWSSLMAGRPGRESVDFVTTLAVFDNKLVAGHNYASTFYRSGSVDIWDGNNWMSLWSGLGEGQSPESQGHGRGVPWYDEPVICLTVYDGKLIVGGDFSEDTTGVSVNSIASWDGISWSPFGSGIHGGVYALALYDDNLVVGGDFTIAGDKFSASLATWTKHDPTDVEENDGTNLPGAFSLVQNFPNPFNPTTTIEYSVPTRAYVTIEIFNLLGQHVRTLVDETKSAGKYKSEWNGTDANGKSASTGVYLYRFTAGDYVETKKMVLLK
jgi:hypothetical protein